MFFESIEFEGRMQPRFQFIDGGLASA
jgi:hypothetical protein